ncbi:MAG: RNA methyltransferase [Porphyromonas sp.]|nr:RNA methyltransferase [Porphyromonas sp.]
MKRKLSIPEMHRLTIDEYKDCQKLPIILVLDNIRSMNNIGSMFRTADAFRLEQLYLCGITATPPHTMIHKTALGAEESVDWTYFSDIQDAITYLKEKKYTICALEQASESVFPQSLHSHISQEIKGIALIVGNEVHGVSDCVMSLIDHCIEIPQYGTKHSLNVSVATGIALYELVKPFLPLIS